MKIKIDLPEDIYGRMRLKELIEEWNEWEKDNSDTMFEESYNGGYVAKKLSLPLVQDAVEHFNGTSPFVNIHIISYEY